MILHYVITFLRFLGRTTCVFVKVIIRINVGEITGIDFLSPASKACNSRYFILLIIPDI